MQPKLKWKENMIMSVQAEIVPARISCKYRSSAATTYELLQLHTVEECERRSALCSISSMSISIAETILHPTFIHCKYTPLGV